MKDERKLMKLPITDAPEIEISESVSVERKSYSGQKYEVRHKCFLYKAEYTVGTLTLTVFNHQKQMVFRVFQRADAYITQFPDKDKPSQASLDHIDDWSGNLYIADGQADETIRRFLKLDCDYYKIHKDDSGFESLGKYQQWLKKKLLDERNDRIRAEIDNAMLEIRPLPKKVLQWVDSAPMRHARYIFYDYAKGRKKMQGFCTHCGRQVEVPHPKHRTQGYCPVCHSPVTFMARGKFSKNYDPTIKDEGAFAYYQSTKDGWCIRLFSVNVWHDVRKLEKAEYDLHEYARYFMKADEPYSAKLFEWDNFKQTGEYRFCKVGCANSITNVLIYPGNLDKVFHRFQDYKYLPMTEFARHSGELDALQLHRAVTEHPWMEYLIKLKFYRLAADVVNRIGWQDALNKHGKNFGEVLGIRKADLPFLQKENPDAKEFAVLKRSLFGWNCKDTDTLKWLMHNAGYGETMAITALVHPAKMKKYILRQVEMRPEDAKSREYRWSGRTESEEEASLRVIGEIAGDWRDYLDECREIGYERSESSMLFPRDLKDAHEKTSTLLEVKENEAEDTKIRKRAAKLREQYAFEDAGLLIRPIANVEELITEGKKLHHCVARYAQSYADGETNIFCIRQAEHPETPHYTLELSDKGHVVQCRGDHNCSVTPEIKAFEEKWLKTCKNRKHQQVPVTVVA